MNGSKRRESQWVSHKKRVEEALDRGDYGICHIAYGGGFQAKLSGYFMEDGAPAYFYTIAQAISRIFIKDR